MSDNYKQEWCGCELKEDTHDPECIDSSQDCEECEVYKKYWADFKKEKEEFEATQKERRARIQASIDSDNLRSEGKP